MKTITLREFIERAPLALDAFQAATLTHATTDSSFKLERDEVDWWREVAAYAAYIELSDRLPGGSES